MVSAGTSALFRAAALLVRVLSTISSAIERASRPALPVPERIRPAPIRDAAAGIRPDAPPIAAFIAASLYLASLYAAMRWSSLSVSSSARRRRRPTSPLIVLPAAPVSVPPINPASGTAAVPPVRADAPRTPAAVPIVCKARPGSCTMVFTMLRAVPMKSSLRSVRPRPSLVRRSVSFRSGLLSMIA